MSLADLPMWASVLTSGFLVMGAMLALIGTIGLLRLDSFYKRVHAPTLGTTMGALLTLGGSIIYFSVSESRPVFYEVLIVIFLSLTTPVTFMLLVRAALYRDRQEGSPEVPRLSGDFPRSDG